RLRPGSLCRPLRGTAGAIGESGGRESRTDPRAATVASDAAVGAGPGGACQLPSRGGSTRNHWRSAMASGFDQPTAVRTRLALCLPPASAGVHAGGLAVFAADGKTLFRNRFWEA